MSLRTLLAFLIAPLAAPLLFGGILFALEPLSSDWAIVAQITLLTAYLGMLLLGAPIAWWMRRRGVDRLGAACGWGCAIGCLSTLGGGLVVAFGLKASLRSSVPVGVDLSWLPFIGFGGLIGTAVGAVFWFIARPDMSRDVEAGAKPT